VGDFGSGDPERGRNQPISNVFVVCCFRRVSIPPNVNVLFFGGVS